MHYIWLDITLFLVVLTLLERFIRVPILATFIGKLMVALFKYPLYHVSGNLEVFITGDHIFSFTIFGKRLSLIPLDATAITIGKVIIVSKHKCSITCLDNILKHEYVHVGQYEDLGSLAFFGLYIWYFMLEMVKSWRKCRRTHRDASLYECWQLAAFDAYYQIPFEIEAREKSGY